MNPRPFLVYSGTAAFVLVLSASLWLWSSKPPAQRPQTEASTADFARRVAGVESELRGVRSLLTRAQPAGTAAEPPSGPAAPDSPPLDEESSDDDAEQARLSPEERDRLQVEATLTTLDNVLESEVVDGVWERESQQALIELFSRQDFVDSQLGRVRCAQTLCKISIQHRDRDAWKKFREGDGLVQPPFRGSGGFSHHSHATNETIVFITRKGQHLPKLTPPAG